MRESVLPNDRPNGRTYSVEQDPERFAGIRRDYTEADVARLSGSFRIRHTLAEMGAARLWHLLKTEPYLPTLGALTGNQALQQVKAGLKAIYLSGWQVAADASGTYWMASIVADAEAGFGGPLNAFELMKAMIEAGAAGVHFEDQLASEKKCGHMGGKVLVPISQHIRTLNAARLAADVLGVPTLLIARTDALTATLVTSDIDPADRPFLTGERTREGYWIARPGLEAAVARARAYAPYADLLWFETARPDLVEAEEFARSVHEAFPGKLLAYNCS